MLELPSQCFSRWFDIGILLDVPFQKLRDIKFSDNTQPDACCIRMFTEWLDGDGNPTWATLSKLVTLILFSESDSSLQNYSTKGLFYIS